MKGPADHGAWAGKVSFDRVYASLGEELAAYVQEVANIENTSASAVVRRAVSEMQERERVKHRRARFHSQARGRRAEMDALFGATAEERLLYSVTECFSLRPCAVRFLREESNRLERPLGEVVMWALALYQHERQQVPRTIGQAYGGSLERGIR